MRKALWILALAAVAQVGLARPRRGRGHQGRQADPRRLAPVRGREPGGAHASVGRPGGDGRGRRDPARRVARHPGRHELREHGRREGPARPARPVSRERAPVPLSRDGPRQLRREARRPPGAGERPLRGRRLRRSGGPAAQGRDGGEAPERRGGDQRQRGLGRAYLRHRQRRHHLERRRAATSWPTRARAT